MSFAFPVELGLPRQCHFRKAMAAEQRPANPSPLLSSEILDMNHKESIEPIKADYQEDSVGPWTDIRSRKEHRKCPENGLPRSCSASRLDTLISLKQGREALTVIFTSTSVSHNITRPGSVTSPGAAVPRMYPGNQVQHSPECHRS